MYNDYEYRIFFFLFFFIFSLPQHEVVEQWAYKQMALLSSAFAFSWSKWNGECEKKEMIIFQGSEALQDEPLLEVS